MASFKQETIPGNGSEDVTPFANDSEEVLLTRQVRSLLNRLTPQNCDTVSNKFKELAIDSEEKLRICVELVFENAINVAQFSEIYAKLCKVIQFKKVLIDGNNNNNQFVNFRRLLITLCQNEFEKQVQVGCKNAERERRWQGIMRFIGKLYKVQMLTARIIHSCIDKMLQNGNDHSLKSVCKLLTTVGKELDQEHQQNKCIGDLKVHFDNYFNQMKTIMEDPKTSAKARFLLQNLVELRMNDWKIREESVSKPIQKTVPGWFKLKTNHWQGPCSHCRTVCTVPFEPTRSPVLCKTCLKKAEANGELKRAEIKKEPLKKSEADRELKGAEIKKEPVMKLYMDGLNYADRFFGSRQKLSDWDKNLKNAKTNVDKFIKAAKKSNISLEVFIDAAVATKETFLKWKSRREKELETGKFYLLPKLGILLGELFQKSGIKVHFSTVDNDDTMASFAYNNLGNILSNDSDFFRYTSKFGEKRSFEIYSNYTIQKGRLCLIPAQLNPKKVIASPRIYISPPPKTSETAFCLHQPMQWEVDELPEIYGSLPNMIKCGNRTCLLQDFQNPELTARPLRQALYSRLGVEFVRERIFTRNFKRGKGKGEWREEEVEADDTFDHLLEDPKEAVKTFFGHEVRPKNKTDVLWKNHLFAQRVVVAAICAWATGKSIHDVMKL